MSRPLIDTMIDVPLFDYLHPLYTFLSPSPIPWPYRWRTLAFLPLNVLLTLITKAPFWFRHKPFHEITYPTRCGPRKAYLYHPPGHKLPRSSATSTSSPLLPIHIALHPGAFIGGHPLTQHRLCTLLSTSTIVIAPTYRFSPLHPYPAAIDDISDLLNYLHSSAPSHFGGDPNLITVSGTSAGGNLALAACQGEGCWGVAKTRVKGVATVYAPIDLQTPPWGKKVLCPEKFPKRDPLGWLQVPYDSYARLSGRALEARCSPDRMAVEMVPEDLLVVTAEVDVVVDENKRFVERMRREAGERGSEMRVEYLEVEDAWHGWLEMPGSIMEKERAMVLGKIVDFVKGVQQRHGCRSF